MKIPRKITPDNIKDSIVQLVFNPLCPPELVVGRFENHLQGLFEFKGGAPSNRKMFRLPNGNELNFEAGVLPGGYFLDRSESVKVTVNSNTLVFNSFKGYPGWDTMYSIIEETIQIMFSKLIIENVNRTGVRYISQFDDVEIFQKIKMTLSLYTSNKSFATTQIRSEYDEEAFKIILNLLNNFERIDNGVKHKFSMVDIDVIKFYKSASTTAREVIESIDKAHFKQKSTFFSLLSDDFLKSLNPEY